MTNQDSLKHETLNKTGLTNDMHLPILPLRLPCSVYNEMIENAQEFAVFRPTEQN